MPAVSVDRVYLAPKLGDIVRSLHRPRVTGSVFNFDLETLSESWITLLMAEIADNDTIL